MPSLMSYPCLLKQMLLRIFPKKQLGTLSVAVETLKGICRTLVTRVCGDVY